MRSHSDRASDDVLRSTCFARKDLNHIYKFTRKKKWLTYAVTVLLVNCHDVTGRIFDRWTSRQTGMKVPLKWHNQPGKKRTFYKVLMEKRTEGRKVKTTHNTCRDCRVHFFWQPFSSKYLYSGNSILKRAKGLAKFVRYNEASLYQGSFPYILLLLG